jgi:adenosylcobinamide kinase / adenosylcobinamide-phosphate guanylyltransferase
MTTTLVLGGARSGKSRYAESLAKGKRFYIATAEILDAEMQARISAHREQRGTDWETMEVPLDLVDAIRKSDGKGNFVLVDCITIWISNLMHAKRDAALEVARLCEMLKSAKARLVLVSNEVGQGIVPDNALARAFRDKQGRANQRLAAAVDEVVLVTAGLPMALKKARRKPPSARRASSSRSRKA